MEPLPHTPAARAQQPQPAAPQINIPQHPGWAPMFPPTQNPTTGAPSQQSLTHTNILVPLTPALGQLTGIFQQQPQIHSEGNFSLGFF